MRRSKLTAVFALLAAGTLFFGGMLSYKLINDRAAGPVAARQASGPREGLTIEGRVAIEVIRNGHVVTSWKGHNALYPYGKNAIAGCISGATTAPPWFGKCSGYITRIALQVTGGTCGGWCEGAAAVNAATPSGCDPTNGFNMCSGWTTSATVSISQNETVIGAAATNDNAFWFDQVQNVNLAVNGGDRVATSITFTVS